MKLIILQKKLRDGLNIVDRVAERNLTLSVLNNVLVTIEKNFLNLATTDLEIGINWWELVRAERTGKIAVPAKILSNFINSLPGEKISLESKDNDLLVKCNKLETQIKGLSPEEFPIIPQVKSDNPIILSNKLLCSGLGLVSDIPQISNARPEISGIFFSFQKDILKMAATDSFRLGEKIIYLDKPLKDEQRCSFILPQKTAKELINILGEKQSEADKQETMIYYSPNQIMFELMMEEISHPEIRVTSRLIDGEYPSYQEIIPKDYQTQMILEKNELLNQIKTASLFSGRTNEIRMKISPSKKELEISSQDPIIGEHRSSLPAKINGQEIEISFNHRFVIEGLLGMKSSEVIFEFNGEKGPGVLKPVGDQSYIYVVMPIKSS